MNQEEHLDKWMNNSQEGVFIYLIFLGGLASEPNWVDLEMGNFQVLFGREIF
jgi:hypothetical protein